MNTRTDFRFINRSRFLLAIALLFLAGAVRANAQASCTGVSSDTQGAVTWTPAWCEEFNGAAGAPDPTVWTYDLGGGGFGNNELEIYCGPAGFAGNQSGCPSGAITSGTVYIDGGGHLVLQAVNPSGTWYSARLKTQGLQNFQYGRIEASIQLPDTTNQGLWPAFWSLGSDINTTPWPGCGEVDFMEVWSPQVLSGPGPAGDRTTLHTAITGGSGLQPNGAFTFPTGQANDTNFHTYGTIWSANMMQFYIDNPLQPYYIATTSNLPSGDTWAFNAQLFLLTNIAVGGTLGGTPSGATVNPGIMMLDYVRQYQPLAAVPAPVLQATPTISVKAGATTGNSSTFTPGLTANTGYVYFSCSTNAPKTTCAISTNDPLNKFVVSSSATPAETVTVTVTTTANTSTAGTTTAQAIPPVFFHLPLSFFNPPLASFILNTPVWLLVTFAAFLLTMVVASARMRVRACLYGCTLAMGLILTGAASCGGGSSNNLVIPPANGTPPGNYTVTVYAFTESNVGDGTNSTADANVAIPLTVN
jgi:beta-glucanase (GH16 family)